MPKHTARYLPSAENVAIHAGEPDSVDGEIVPIGSTDDDGIRREDLLDWMEHGAMERNKFVGGRSGNKNKWYVI